MTNKEKFVEIFGFVPVDSCPCSVDNDICDAHTSCDDDCPYNEFWGKEYSEKFGKIIEGLSALIKENSKHNSIYNTNHHDFIDDKKEEYECGCDYDCENCIHNFDHYDDCDFCDMEDEDEKVDLITAEDARKVSDHYIKDAFEKEIRKLNKEIADACKIGKDSVCIDGSVSVDAKELLIKNGFKVTTGSQYNESYTNIKWGV